MKKTLEQQKAEIRIFLTSLHYEAADNGQENGLKELEQELEQTTDIKAFLKNNNLVKNYKEHKGETAMKKNNTATETKKQTEETAVQERPTFREAAEEKAKKIALYVIQAVTVMNKTQAAYVLGDNAIKSASKIGAMYRKTAFCKSYDFILRTEAVLSQADDTLYWLELIEDCGAGSKGITEMAVKETKDFAAMVGAGLKKIKERTNAAA